MHIPEHLIEPLATFVRLCRNANEGDRLDKIRTLMRELHPELSEEQMTDVIQRGANLFVSKTKE